MKGKRGQFAGLQSAVVIMLFIGILLGVGTLISINFSERLDDNSFSKSNEEATTIGTTSLSEEYNLSGASDPRAHSFTLTGAVNTTGDDIALGNFTIVGSLVNNDSATIDTHSQDPFNLSYTYKAGDTAYEGTSQVSSVLADIPGIIGLLLVVFMTGIILAILFRSIPGIDTGEGM